MWVLPRGNVREPCGRRKLRRVNPKSAAGVKQNRHGLGGSKPPRGSPNPEGGTKRVGKPANSGPPNPGVLKGTKAHERCWSAAAGWLGSAG
jgi:hypothetical protein